MGNSGENNREGDKWTKNGAFGRLAASEGDDPITKQDRLLPIANVERIMKKILPPNAKISKEAKVTVQESATEFISFVTGEASDKCLKQKRKTLNGDDICWALGAAGLDDLGDATRKYLQKYRASEDQRAEGFKDSFAIYRAQDQDIFRGDMVRDNQTQTSTSFKLYLEDLNRGDTTPEPR